MVYRKQIFLSRILRGSFFCAYLFSFLSFFVWDVFAANEQVILRAPRTVGGDTTITTYSLPNSGLGFAQTESNIAAPMPSAGCYHNFRFKTSVAPDNGAGVQAFTWTFRKNGANTSLACTISESDTSCQDTTNTACYDVGDTISVSRTATDVPAEGAITWTALFTPEENGETVYLTSLSSGNLPTSGSKYITALFPGLTTTVGGQADTVMPVSGTFKNLYVELPFAPNNGAGVEEWTFTIQKNGSDSALSVALTDAETSDSDTTNSVSFAAGDTVRLGITVSSGTPIAFGQCGIGVTFVPDENGYSVLAVANNDDLSASTTEYVSLNYASAWNSFETNRNTPVHAFVAKTMYVGLQSDPDNGGGTQSYTFTLRDDTADTGLSVALSDGETTDNSTSGDEGIVIDSLMAIKVTPANTPTVGKAVVSVGAYRTPARRD